MFQGIKFIPKYKLMKKDRKTEINTKKLKNKSQQEKSLVVNLLGLILMDKILICMLKLVKYTITLINHVKSH